MIEKLSAYANANYKMKRGRTDRETLHLNGWTVGDVLEGDEDGRIAVILITAVGWTKILAAWFDCDKGVFLRESSTTLCAREWRKIGRQK